MGRGVIAMIDGLHAQRGHLFPWAPVCVAAGIGGYFSLLSEPTPTALLVAVAISLLLVVAGRWLGSLGAPVAWGIALALLGFSLAGARAHLVSAPLLDFRYYGAVEGRIVGIDRSASDAMRLTLDRVVLERMAPESIPERVRISLLGDRAFDPLPGSVIMTTAHLSPPNGPVEPGGFDFRRNAWFQEIGGVGYTRVPVLYLEKPDSAMPIFSARMALASHVRALLPGETGAFAAAVMTGDRSGMGQATLQALRDSNLAHLLAISGLHMGLLAGVVFSALRLIFLLIPALALRLPIKKIAALGALAGGAGYLALSGGNVATQRAFIMVAVALVAILLDRRALSLRAVAMAALIILALWPEELLGPGFQMSFAATAALVAVFALLRDAPTTWRAPRWLAPVLAVLLSSFVAGAATAPIGMAHFNQSSHFGLLANLVSVPLMGLVVMPMVVVCVVLLPFGLEWIALWPMKLGLDWILAVANEVASWENAVGHVKAPGPWVLPVLVFGAIFVMLWQGRPRWLGLVAMAGAAIMWHQSERPLVLISDDGALVGVMTDAGRALSRPSGAGFVARNWLENDGGDPLQENAFLLWVGARSTEAETFELERSGLRLRHVQGKRAREGFVGCDANEIVVANTDLPDDLPCITFDAERLRLSGATSLIADSSGLRLITARERAGNRLWHGPKPQPAAAPTNQYVRINPTSLP